jgi:hypothetical protein
LKLENNDSIHESFADITSVEVLQNTVLEKCEIKDRLQKRQTKTASLGEAFMSLIQNCEIEAEKIGEFAEKVKDLDSKNDEKDLIIEAQKKLIKVLKSKFNFLL